MAEEDNADVEPSGKKKGFIIMQIRQLTKKKYYPSLAFSGGHRT